MFRCVLSNALRVATSFAPSVLRGSHVGVQQRMFSSFLTKPNFVTLPTYPTLLAPASLSPVQQQSRNVTKFSLKKGKRKTVKAVLKRFKRLHWGAWIRTYTGRHKKLFKKSAARKRRLRQHVLVNTTQSWLLDKMVTKYWRRPKHYIDDPYAPYHERNEFFATKNKVFKV